MSEAPPPKIILEATEKEFGFEPGDIVIWYYNACDMVHGIHAQLYIPIWFCSDLLEKPTFGIFIPAGERCVCTWEEMLDWVIKSFTANFPAMPRQRYFAKCFPLGQNFIVCGKEPFSAESSEWVCYSDTTLNIDEAKKQ